MHGDSESAWVWGERGPKAPPMGKRSQCGLEHHRDSLPLAEWQIYYLAAGREKTTEMCGDGNKRKKKNNVHSKVFLGTLFLGMWRNATVLLSRTQDSRTSLIAHSHRRWRLGNGQWEGGVIWIPEPAWPLLGLSGDRGLYWGIRSHCIFCISQNHLYHQHSWEPTALSALQYLSHITFGKKLRSLPNWAPTFSNLASRNYLYRGLKNDCIKLINHEPNSSTVLQTLLLL